jgi:hypothetical protein
LLATSSSWVPVSTIYGGEIHALNLAGRRKILETGEVIEPGEYVYEPPGNEDSWMAVGDEPLVVFLTARGAIEYIAERMAPLNPVLNTPGSIFDDKMVVVNASIRGDIRGIALPLLLDLDRKPVFLHDNTVPTLDNLFDSARGATAPHPFYLDGRDRADMIALMRSFSAD